MLSELFSGAGNRMRFRKSLAPMSGPVGLDSLSYPKSDDPYAQFEAFVIEIDRLASGDSKHMLQLLWPLWRDVDRLVVARRGVALCFESLDWTFEPYADAIARRIQESFQVFAELELDFDILSLAQRLIGEAPPTAELHHYLLAHLLDPTEKEFARVIMLGAANAKIIDPIRFLLPEFGNQLGDLFFTQLLKTAERVGFTLPMDILAQIADFLREPETLAGLAVGTAISRGLTDDVANEHKSLHELMTGKRIRNLLHEKLRGPSPIPPQPSTPVDPNLFGRLYHRLSDCKREMRAQNEDSIPLKRGSAEVSWLNFMLERGPTTIEPKSFFSNARKIDGALTAASHSANEALQWGPYVTLQPGCYTVTFLGEMEAHLTAAFEITAAYGEQLLARNVEIASGEGKHEVLAHLSVCLETKVEACEFVIYPRTRAGLIISRGVRIEWRPLSGSSPDFSK